MVRASAQVHAPKILRGLAAGLVAPALCLQARALPVPTYTIIELPPIAHDASARSQAWRISQAGLVAGMSDAESPPTGRLHLTRWDAGEPTDLTPGTTYHIHNVSGLSDSGSIIAFGAEAGGLLRSLYLHQGTLHTGAFLDPYSGSAGNALAMSDDGGLIVGVGRAPGLGGAPYSALHWTSAAGVGFALPTLGGAESAAMGVGPDATIVGWSQALPGSAIETATLWKDAQATAIGPAGGAVVARALDVNESGVVVGHTGPPDRAFVWTQALGLSLLPGQGGLLGDGALAVGRDGTIVGFASDAAGYDAVAWVQGQPSSLRERLWNPEGWARLTLASDINAVGEIVGQGIRGPATRGFLLIPCIADFDRDLTIDSDDFFSFLSAYVAGDPRADIAPRAGDGRFTTDDFFAYLLRYVEGCG